MWNTVLHLDSLHNFSSNALHISHFSIKPSPSVASLILPSDCLLIISNYIICSYRLQIYNLLQVQNMWWFDSGWIPGAHQSCSITLLSWTEKWKYSKNLMNREKERTEHSSIPVKGKRESYWGNLGKIIYYQIRVGESEKKNQIFHPTCPDLHYLLPTTWAQRHGVEAQKIRG